MPTLATNGYKRIATPSGCYRHDEDHNVQLSPELEGSLLGLLEHGVNTATCWQEQPDGSLFLAVGDECGVHLEAEFERLAEKWVIRAEREVHLVICDERAR
jgi:hypothetical protein